MGRQDLGQAIRSARLRAGESQAEFAEHFKVTQQTAGAWEQFGKVAKRHWDMLKRQYGVDPEQFLDEEDELRKQSIRSISSAIALSGSRAGLINVGSGGGIALSAMEQTLIEELRKKDSDGEILRAIRHTFRSRLIPCGIPAEVAETIVGHATLLGRNNDVMQTYIHINDKDMVREIAKLSYPEIEQGTLSPLPRNQQSPSAE